MRKPLHIALALLVIAGLGLSACGRKGPPRWVEHAQPAAPTGLRSQVRPESVTLRWDYAGEADIEGFSVMRIEEGLDGGETVILDPASDLEDGTPVTKES